MKSKTDKIPEYRGNENRTSGRRNKINFVESIYLASSGIDDRTIKKVLSLVYSTETSAKTLSVWKARLRKKGVLIPDKRFKSGEV